MSELLSTFLTPGVKATLMIILAVIVVLYIMSILWVVRDSYLRGVSPVVWGIIAIIPFLGAMIYAMLRPPLYASDQEEQNIGLLLQQRQLMSFGECPQCGYPTERDYIMCPNCHAHLKKSCEACGRTLEPEWTVCPYCATRVGGGQAQQRKRVPRAASAAAKPASQSSSATPAKTARARTSSADGGSSSLEQRAGHEPSRLKPGRPTASSASAGSAAAADPKPGAPRRTSRASSQT